MPNIPSDVNENESLEQYSFSYTYFELLLQRYFIAKRCREWGNVRTAFNEVEEYARKYYHHFDKNIISHCISTILNQSDNGRIMWDLICEIFGNKLVPDDIHREIIVAFENLDIYRINQLMDEHLAHFYYDLIVDSILVLRARRTGDNREKAQRILILIFNKFGAWVFRKVNCLYLIIR